MTNRLLGVWIALALASCGGELLITAPKIEGGCPETPCPAGFVCNELGACVDDGTEGPLCNPVNIIGSCLGDDVCVDGVCYTDNNEPAACSTTAPTRNGVCANDQACVSGACQAIPSGSECSTANPTGLCPGGERCVFGTCFVDDGLACSQTRPDGVCPAGQSCAGGFCLVDAGTCSPFEPDGSCPAWERCVQGDCYGPAAPDACSSSRPNGRCAAEDVCVGGNCTAVLDNACSENNITGLCPAGAACVSGRCYAITEQNGCAPGRPQGVCPGAAVCVNGACTQRPCDNGGYLCDPGNTCVSDTCVPTECDLSHTDGVCVNSEDVCDEGVCLPPSCSLAAPEGTCPTGLECDAGECVQPPCSLEHPSGLCSDGDVCDAGECVEGPCSATNTDGVCEGQTRVCHPTSGCNTFVDNVCCDASMVGSTGCTVGTCAPAECSATVTNGACPPGEYCDNGECEPAPCSVFALDGYCAGQNETCVLGKCTKTGCVGQDASYCAPQTCDIGTNTCVTPECSAEFPDGRCQVGRACCNSELVTDMGCTLGSCVTPPCSTTYPGGTCTGGQICAGGSCVTPPCSATNPNGDCGPNFVCNSGTCERAACSDEVPTGACPQGERCDGDSCEDFICSAAFPTAPCPIGTICQDCSGTPCCQQPACSATYPGGACPSGQLCSGGGCVPAPCSLAFPTGACGAGFTCVSGFCQAAPCGPSSQNGTCVDSDPLDDVREICLGGVCTPYACASNPALQAAPCYDLDGNYLPNFECDAGFCEEPECDAAHPGGVCLTTPSEPPEVCVAGACVPLACSASVTNGVCPGNQVCCDSALAGTRGCSVGSCVLRDCSPTYTSGRCDVGEVCCNSSLVSGGVCTNPDIGDCVAITCSAQFPTGACVGADAGKICVGGACTTPCSSTNKNGWCPGAFSCVEGGCSPICDSGNDRDCDTISNAHEQGVDTDNDGYPDDRDRDSDGDGVPDVVEAGDLSLATLPVDTDNDGVRNFRDLDSDGDFIADSLEVGALASVPVDTDSDGTPDMLDTDSDADGILDRCEVSDVGAGICTYNGPIITVLNNVRDSDGDNVRDFRDLDSDDDGVSDIIEARAIPSQPGTFNANGVDHDNDDTPDYRDTDSDGDGVLDEDEDVNGDGIVNCQVDGAGAAVADPRSSPTCVDAGYNYNPGCPTQKCLLAESSRVHVDTDDDDIDDGDDGVYLVCSTENLKPINLFYSREADFALALEQTFTTVRTVRRGAGGAQAGMTFDDPVATNGSYGVSGFVVNHPPAASVRATASSGDPARDLINKALAQEVIDRAAMAGATGVSAVTLVINRNFTSFDGYGVVVSRYNVTTSSAQATAVLRDNLARRLDAGITHGWGGSGGPSATQFTLTTETLYRYDNGTTGAVMVVAALVPTNAYNFRDTCDDVLCSAVPTLTIEAESSTSRQSLGSSKNWTNQTHANASGGSYIQALTDSGSTSCDANNTFTNCGARVSYTFNIAVAGTYAFRFRGSGPNGSGDSFWWRVDGGSTVTRFNPPNGGVTTFGWATNESGGLQTLNVALTAGSHTLDIGMREDGTALDYIELSYVGCVASCEWPCTQSGNSCTQSASSDYQMPLFYADNIANGSALAQYGDDVAALCQSLVQDNGKLDFLWVVDNSGSMAEEIDQVQQSSNLFFQLFNNTEADYRVGQVTSAENVDNWEPTYAFTGASADETNRRNGMLIGDFTGAIAGIVDTASTDRTVGYTCSTGCFNGQPCCPACPAAVTTNDPSCYFASRLPDINGSGDEFGLLMGQWAAYRSGADVVCGYLNASECAAFSGCGWRNGSCMPTYCELSGADNTAEQCNGNDTSGSTQVPFGADNTEDELEPLGCEWHPLESACWPSVGLACGNNTTQNNCNAQAPRCQWLSNTCVPNISYGSVLCSAFDNQTTCAAQGGGWCQWDTNLWGTGVAGCRPPTKRAFRPDAERFLVVLSDEEECYFKDTDFNGGCTEAGSTGGLAATSAIRIARTKAMREYFEARNFSVFGIVGDKTVGCSTAGPGTTYADVSEGTGGGWGSICAADLYPTIESIVISAVAKASPYELEGFIDGRAVQPISSTIKVAVEVCDVPAQYPACASGTHMEVVPRSRDDGFDYDGLNNTLILYGNARPASRGDIVVSYRYWVDNEQDPEGGDCPCPETSGPNCECPAGQACGYSGSGSNVTDLCVGATTQLSCEDTPGCAWSSPTATCVPTGLCEPDPDCGGSCGAGEVCDPTLGLCVCDVTCAATCGAGQTCDNNVVINNCQGKNQATCGVTTGCSWDSAREACYSVTCGECFCDISCGNGCPAGQQCNDDVGDANCGECECDTTCGGGCPSGQLCNNDPMSATCGFCQPPQCGQCGSGTVCDTSTGLCVCDTLCGGGCPQGRECETSTASANCGQCVCDTTCGGACPQGMACNSDPGSPSCGLCAPLADCGVGGDCNPSCDALTSASACDANTDCRWAPWEGTNGLCVPIACSVCNSAAGLCVADPNCCGACGPAETCNASTGECECDTQCGLSCAPGLTCDGNVASPTCGLCQCDTSCGGPCPDGLVCDDNSECGGFATSNACVQGGCTWDGAVGRCLSATCGRCVVDPECGNDCTGNEACNPSTGLCEPQCPECFEGELCDTLTGNCICDQTCGGGCPIGKSCDGDINSATCGQCTCDTSCGGSCPAGQYCDDGTTCSALATNGACQANLDCAIDGSECFSPTCGLCVIDETCGGGCPNGQVCSPLNGLCIPDPNCGGCPDGFICDELRGTCVPIEE